MSISSDVNELEGRDVLPAFRPSLEDALWELRLFLSDRLIPKNMAESLTLLRENPPELVAGEIYAWAGAQTGPATRLDYLSLALRRVLSLGTPDQRPVEGLQPFIRRVAEAVVARASLEERARLLPLVGLEARDDAAAPPRVARPSSPASSQRLTLLLDRLDGVADPAATKSERELVVETLIAAVLAASTPSDLEGGLEDLRRRGFFRDTREGIEILVETLSSWWVPGVPSTVPPALAALERIVSLPDPAERARRFSEMVRAGVLEFNRGALGRAARVFELAERMVAEGAVEADRVEGLRASGHESLDLKRVRQLLESQPPGPFPPVLLRFFRVFVPDALVEKLRREPRWERRRLLLAFLVTHGADGRRAAAERLTRLPEDEHDFYLLRNLVCLLRKIPRSTPDSGDLERELGRVVRLLAPDNPPYLVREVLSYLERTRHPVAEQVLVLFLRALEDSLTNPYPDAWEEDHQRWFGYLDRVAMALARYGSPRTWSALVEHGLEGRPSSGERAARLAPLAEEDLGAVPDLAARLVAAVRAEIPRSLLAPLPGSGRVLHLVRALSGTRTPEVRELFQALAARFPGHEVGRVAARGLAVFDAAPRAKPPSGACLSGDLHIFGLPTLLQNLADSGARGVLTVLDGRGRTTATLVLAGDHLRGARYGNLTGPAALYQLLERPFPGTFAFAPRENVAAPGEPSFPVTLLILEGLRRHDELQRAARVVPDHAVLEPTSSTPTPIPGEADIDFVMSLWEKATAGLSPAGCESALSVDALRVRHGFVHWLNQGALRFRPRPTLGPTEAGGSTPPDSHPRAS